MYQGSRKGTSAAFLRSYDSRAEPPPEFDCKIWEAGRATCAIGLAFKPIRIGQSVFHDDGIGTFNPSPEVLDETVSEWPGREIGVFLSIGTGRRPKSSDANQAMWYEGFLGEFADARRKLISKIEGCEAIHEYMMREHLGKRGVNIENYYRLNVEIGVGEFGMNEWNQLAQISTGTKQYLRREREHRTVVGSATKLARIFYANKRAERVSAALPPLPPQAQAQAQAQPQAAPPPPPTFAVELPAFVPQGWPTTSHPALRQSFDTGPDVAAHSPAEMSPHLASEASHPHSPRIQNSPPPRSSASTIPDSDRLDSSAPTPAQYRAAAGTDKIAIMAEDEHPRASQDGFHPQEGRHPAELHPSPLVPGRTPHPPPYRIEPPPLPPKTPLPGAERRRVSAVMPPYPVDDEAPPAVNMARKPEFRGR